MSEIKSVQCANFTAALGETFRFSLDLPFLYPGRYWTPMRTGAHWKGSEDPSGREKNGR